MESQVNIYGVTVNTAAAYADNRATREAIRVAAMSDATWPASDKRMQEIISEILIEHALNFAIHARRHLALEKAQGVKVPDISGRLSNRYDVESFSGSLWRALQILVHSTELMMVPVQTGNVLYSNAGDMRICYLKVTEEGGKQHYFCPFGLAHSYLGRHGRTNPSL